MVMIKIPRKNMNIGTLIDENKKDDNVHAAATTTTSKVPSFNLMKLVTSIQQKSSQLQPLVRDNEQNTMLVEEELADDKAKDRKVIRFLREFGGGFLIGSSGSELIIQKTLSPILTVVTLFVFTKTLSKIVWNYVQDRLNLHQNQTFSIEQVIDHNNNNVTASASSTPTSSWFTERLQ